MDSMRGMMAKEEPLGTDDAAIEAPPTIGTDERRMQVRAYNFWAQMLADRAYPSVDDLNLDRLDDFGPHSVLLDFTAGIDNPGIAFLGDRLREECQLSEDIQYIDEVPSRSLLSRLTDHYLQIIANRAPIGFEAEYVNARGTTIMYRGILLPFSSDDDTIDFIMGVINWKEAAPLGEADELQLEVEQALRAAPQRHAMAPVWADGPAVHTPTSPAFAGDSAMPTAPAPVARLAPLVGDDDDGWDDQDAGHDTAPGFSLLGMRSTPRKTPLFIRRDDSLDLSDAPVAADMADMVDMADESVPDAAVVIAEPDAGADLADWLAFARDVAAQASDADVRSRGALYCAVGRAHDFALVAAAAPDAYAEMLADAGLKVQGRAPMTPLVKLIFGADYDKTRLAEFACALTHARDSGVPRGGLATYLDRYPGGLKGLVRDERARRKAPATPEPDRLTALIEALRAAPPHGVLEYDSGGAEFVLLVARRIDDGHVGVVAAVNDDAALIERAMRKARLD